MSPQYRAVLAVCGFYLLVVCRGLLEPYMPDGMAFWSTIVLAAVMAVTAAAFLVKAARPARSRHGGR